MTDLSSTYEVFPLRPTPARADVISDVLRRLCGFETALSDHQRGCEERCYEDEPFDEMCERCQGAFRTVSGMLLRPDSRVWEVWRVPDGDAEPSVAGILLLTRIRPGEDAVAHYVFFDGSLSSKTAVIERVLRWVFSDSEGWSALRRVTVEIPDYAYALARHAHRKLGFGGPFFYRLDEGEAVYAPDGDCRRRGAIRVEGVKRDALTWRGERRDLVVLGLRREEFMEESDAALNAAA